jgi:type II secretory pathway pseudopilin PulG
MLAVFVLAGSAIGFAKTGSNDKGKETSAAVHARNDAKAAEREAAKEAKQNEQSSDHERKLNHGFYVSTAAHCENVDDPSTPASNDFTAPADCNDGGSAHGKYVSSVAQSSVGKPDKAHGPNK